MAQFQAYNKIMLCDEEGLQALKQDNCFLGYTFKCKYPSYRGTFLSCIEEFEVQIDNQIVESENIIFCLNNKKFLLSQLPELYTEYWFILDKATVIIRRQNKLSPGEHKLSLKIRHKIPYTGYFGEYLSLDSHASMKVNI